MLTPSLTGDGGAPYYFGDSLVPMGLAQSSDSSSLNPASITNMNFVQNSGSSLYRENVTVTYALQLHSWTLNVRKNTTLLPGETVLNVLYKTPTEHQLIRGHIFFVFNQSTLLDKALTTYALGGNTVQGSMSNANEKTLGAEWAKVNEILREGYDQQMNHLTEKGFNIYHSFSNRQGKGGKMTNVLDSVSHPDSLRQGTNQDSIQVEVHVPVYDEMSDCNINHVDIFKFFYEDILCYQPMELRSITGFLLLKHFKILCKQNSDESFDSNKFPKPSVYYGKQISPENRKILMKKIPMESDIYKAYRRSHFWLLVSQADDIELEYKEARAHQNRIFNLLKDTMELFKKTNTAKEFQTNLIHLFYDALCNYFGAENYVRFCTCQGILETWNLYGVVQQGIESHPNTVIPGFDESTRAYPIKNFAIAGRTEVINRWGNALMTGDSISIILKKRQRFGCFQLYPFHNRNNISIENIVNKSKGERGLKVSIPQINKYKENVPYPPKQILKYKDFNGVIQVGAVFPVGKIVNTHETDIKDEFRLWSIGINPSKPDEDVSNERAVSMSRPLWNDKITIAFRFN